MASRTPVIRVWDCAETLTRLITFWSAPSRKTPAIAPPRVPLPLRGLPPDTFLAFQQALRARNMSAPPSLWNMLELAKGEPHQEAAE
jgi:hypothetical protein